MFDLKRPCVDCPFRISGGWRFGLNATRIREIATAPAFPCHKTVRFHDEEDGPYINVDGEDFDETYRPILNDDKQQQCAGLMALLHRIGQPNQIMQVAQRLSGFDADTIESADVYLTVEQAIAEHSKA